MKKFENSIAVTGFVAQDAEIRQFSTASVARFPIAVARLENDGTEDKRVSALLNFEVWRKNENGASFELLKKGTMLTVEGYLKPEEWTATDGAKRNRIVFVATKFYEPVEKSAETGKGKSKSKSQKKSR